MDRTYITATGEFRIEPPLTWAEFKDSPHRPERAGAEPDVLFEIETTEIDGPNGTMLLHRAASVRPYAPGQPFAYRGDLVKTMMQLLHEYGDSHRFVGHFEARESRDHTPSDPWRVLVRNGYAVRVEPAITWPED